MKSIKSFRLILPMVVFVLAAMVSSCDKSERGLLDTVPDSAQAIATVDFDELLKNAGCQVKDGKYELTPQLTSLLGNSDARSFAEWLSRFSKVVDLNHVVIYMMDKTTTIGTVSVTDLDGLESALTHYDLHKVDGREGYDIYEGEDGSVAMLKDGQAWFARKADYVIKSVKKAEKDPLASLVGVKEFLLTEHPLNFAYRYSGISFNWVCGSVALNDNIMGMTIKGMDDDGKLLEFDPLFDAVNTDFLRYTPGNTQLAAAFSVKADVPWDQALAILKAHPGLSMSQKGMLEMVFSQLKKIDGTVALTAAPAAGAPALANFSLSTWDLMLMAHMPQNEVNANVSQLVATARQFGITVDEENGVYHANLSRLDPSLGDVYVGNVDGYFAVSTRPFDSNSNNSLTQVFQGRGGAVALDIPYGSETMKAFGLPYGLSVTLQLEKKSVEMRARFNGTNGSFLSSLIDMIQKMN